MGKAAQIEQIKLNATYNNNLAVGFFIAGGVVPYFIWLQRIFQEGRSIFTLQLSPGEWAACVGMLACLAANIYLRRSAKRIAGTIPD